MTRIDQLRVALQQALEPVELWLEDHSEAHAQHAHGGRQSHLAVQIVSVRFEGLPAAARHRAVYAAASSVFADGLHALEIQAMTPTEFARKIAPHP